MPPGNRVLRPLMIADQLGSNGMIRYPGALLRRTGVSVSASSDCSEGSAFTVGIPELQGTTARWRAVVEPAQGRNNDRYALVDGGGGWADVRVNYPFQSAGLLPWRETGAVDPGTGQPATALETYVPDSQISDDGLAALGAARTAPAQPLPGPPRPYSGALGRGTVYSPLAGTDGSAQPVRPYRRLLSASAGFRRELFLP